MRSRVNWNSASWIVPSLSLTVSTRHIPAQTSEAASYCRPLDPAVSVSPTGSPCARFGLTSRHRRRSYTEGLTMFHRSTRLDHARRSGRACSIGPFTDPADDGPGCESRHRDQPGLRRRRQLRRHPHERLHRALQPRRRHGRRHRLVGAVRQSARHDLAGDRARPVRSQLGGTTLSRRPPVPAAPPRCRRPTPPARSRCRPRREGRAGHHDRGAHLRRRLRRSPPRRDFVGYGTAIDCETAPRPASATPRPPSARRRRN